ncbi:hypothetical protein F5Y17DRAFT_469108 [Xylariaceae sp. FL0594]|nr:hypothetical protein F5Y17DRAFT_469108 [Xylariaceae sp. FL0594]
MAPPSKKRRVHNKSRRGCQQCKERHIKCDEQLPSCAHCSVTNRACSFIQLYTRQADTAPCGSGRSSVAPPPSDTCSSVSVSAPSPDANNASELSPRDVVAPPPPSSQPVFDLSHLALLHHLETDMARDPRAPLVVDAAVAPQLVDMLVTAGLSMPYLMDEVLAFAALHLSVLTPDAGARARYRHQAVELQTRALALYHAASPVATTEDNCTALCMFASLVALHTLYDTVTVADDATAADLLDRFVQFAGLYRGVGVVVEDRWHVFRTSEISGIVGLIEEAEAVPLTSGGLCDHLLHLLEASKERLAPSALTACQGAVDALIWTFHKHDVLQKPNNRHMVFAWPIRITSAYLEMLRSRQPEALVIMAYWGLLLHRERDFWIFGKGGQALIEAIQSYLGPYWDKWIIPLKEDMKADYNVKTS